MFEMELIEEGPIGLILRGEAVLNGSFYCTIVKGYGQEGNRDVPNQAFQQKKVKVGDLLVGINGRDVLKIGHEIVLLKILNASRPLSLTFARTANLQKFFETVEGTDLDK
jgi:hypothetical protein